MKLLSLSLILAGGLALAPIAANAAPLLGSTITGTLSFDGVPNQFNNSTTTVTTGVEFTYTDSYNTDTANFGALGFVIDDDCTYSGCNINNPFTMTFTDTAFTGDTLKTDAAANNLGLTYSLVGDVITLNYDGRTIASGDNTSTFALTPPAATPEPGSLVLLGTGMLAAAGAARRRLLA